MVRRVLALGEVPAKAAPKAKEETTVGASDVAQVGRRATPQQSSRPRTGDVGLFVRGGGARQQIVVLAKVDHGN